MNHTYVEKFTGLVDEACLGSKSVYGKWRDAAGYAVSVFGADWLCTKDVAFMSTRNSDERKAANARLKELRNIVTGQAEARELSNPRKTWADFLKYAREEAGIAPKGDKGKSGNTHYDKLCEGLRMVRNHLFECEPQVYVDLETAWAELEAAAVTAGLLKEAE
jgi:hypothetical protein